jgi:protein-tyrosine phosphatase
VCCASGPPHTAWPTASTWPRPGAPPDARSQAHALRRGVDLSAQRARHFTARDFEHFDWVVAMDAGHYHGLRRLCPPQHTHKLKRAADFSEHVPTGGVPDPYYGDAAGFELVLDLVDAMCEGVLLQVREQDAPTGSQEDGAPR